MKKVYLCLLVCLGLVASCGGGGDEIDENLPEENTAPTSPSQVYPTNNTLCIDNNVKFEWNVSTDSEGHRITYKIEIAEDDSFSNLTTSGSSTSVSKTMNLSKGKAYYWRMKAVDSKGAESAYTQVSQFLTEGDGTSNHLPFVPTLLLPSMNSEVTGTSTTLSWSASDVDNDTLAFDVYLDTNADPTTKVSTDQSATTYAATSLTAGTTYYFKIVVKDGKGGVSIGQIWSFKTK